MVTINLAYSAPINRPSQSPTLTIPQLWAGLQHKIRFAQDFVPAIISTYVLEERVDEKKGVPVVVREVVFKEGNRRVREECWEWAPCKVCSQPIILICTDWEEFRVGERMVERKS